jgi:hypothetical protein
LDAYAVGYCIANFRIGVSWDVGINDVNYYHFVCGLNTNIPGVGAIISLQIGGNIFDLERLHQLDLADLKASLPHVKGITSLSFDRCSLNDNDMFHLSKLIPHLTCLKELSITYNPMDQQEGGLLIKILQQLYDSNVTSLDITETGVDSIYHYISALRCLIHPSSGKLEHLGVGNVRNVFIDESKLVELLYPSSLLSLDLYTADVRLHAVHLKGNTHLTRLLLSSELMDSSIPHLIDIVNHNKTLKILMIQWFRDRCNIDALKALASALHKNDTLEEINLWTETDEGYPYIETNCKELTTDSRITWKYGSNI